MPKAAPTWLPTNQIVQYYQDQVENLDNQGAFGVTVYNHNYGKRNSHQGNIVIEKEILTRVGPQTAIFLHLHKVESPIEAARKLMAKNKQENNFKFCKVT